MKRVLLCSGKVYYALHQERLRRPDATDVAIIRVEQLYPFPADELAALLATYESLSRVSWVQEEPQNMGSWRNLRHRIEKILPAGLALTYAGRHSAGVPSTGSHEVHAEEERRFIAAAFTAAGDALPKPTMVEPER